MSIGTEKPRSRRNAPQSDSYHVRHRLDHRSASHLRHGDGAGGLAKLRLPEITEERLLASVRSTLGGQVNALRSPPIVPDTDRSNPFEEQSYVGVPVAPFPRWMLCPRLSAAGSPEQRPVQAET